ncbi:ComF family protein [Acetobacterium woodii]|uniref:Phosphoribosyltransferase domain-containing protein n=1 Tax=Acetobacterium woodii (strain ATCC 29683 / DSM 1030 / JCM 2381 / KCTC 1655 / WB1) TaxID=931626 RepID=H6LFG0_ACEWD|nr:phosphoribosyltransferase family protein [Acetobacterium woodii]AFA49447.1 hypothetical protein Awo_c26940 [Acetobacterium woodii DSM 1030]
MGPGLSCCHWIKDIDLIIPVPLHPHRLAERGYNQSEMIAQGIVQWFSQNDRHDYVPVLETEVLRRDRDTPHQIGQGRKERLQNLTGAFKVENIKSIQNKTILLVDDVLTTGATLAESSATLLEAGAKEVYVATVCAVAG